MRYFSEYSPYFEAVHLAAQKGHVEIVSALVNAIDFNPASLEMWIDVASRNGNHSVVRELTDAHKKAVEKQGSDNVPSI